MVRLIRLILERRGVMREIALRFSRTVFVVVVIFTLVFAPLSSRVTAQDGQGNGGYAIRRDVNLVVLPTTVVDKKGQFVDGLTAKDFSVYEIVDKKTILQKIEIVEDEDVPVSVGLVIDNSSSMLDKRDGVNAAALTFVEASNIEDEMFVVNFNNEAKIDQEFTGSVSELREALERVEGRGNTALYDAIISSMDYLHKDGKRDKKVLLVVTDGEDRTSTKLEWVVAELQKSDVIVYAVGILGDDTPRRERNRARQALERLTKATGGLAFFPENDPGEIEADCRKIAHDIRNQYTLGYYSSVNPADQKFREVKVQVKGYDVRHRTGYFPKPAPVKK